MNYLRNLLIVVVVCLVLVQSLAVFALGRGHDGIAAVKYYNPKTGESKPFFPFGWYIGYVPKPDGRHVFNVDWDLIIASGAQIVHVPDLRFSTIDIGAFLDAAHKHGIKVVPHLERRLMTGVDPAKPESYEEIARIINTYKNHPAILGWKMGDENEICEYVSPADTVNTAKVIRKFDSNNQIWQGFCGLQLNNSERITPYVPRTDVVSFCQYFETDNRRIFGGANATLYHVTSGTAFASQERLPCTIVVQGVGNDNIVPRLASLAKWRIPAYQELRWNVFSAITSGARGIDLFILPANMAHWYKDPNDGINFVKNTVGSVFGELKQIKYAMETGYNIGKVKITWDGKIDELRLWSKNFDGMSQLLLYDKKQKSYFLIVTNNTSKDRDFKVTLSQLPVKLSNPKAVVMQTGKAATLKKAGNDSYHLKDTMGDHGVMLYCLFSD